MYENYSFFIQISLWFDPCDPIYLMLNKRQTIIWTNDDLVNCLYASLGLNELRILYHVLDFILYVL